MTCQDQVSPTTVPLRESEPEIVQLPGRVLFVSRSVPPRLSGSATIIDNLRRQFGAAEMVVAGRCSPIEADNSEVEEDVAPVVAIASNWWPLKRAKTLFEWVKWLGLPIVVWRLWRLSQRENCSILLVVYPDAFFLLAAYLVARGRRLPFFPYFHNSYLENSRGPSRILAAWLQPRVFRTARVVFVMSRGLQEFYDGKYPEVRFLPLVHSSPAAIPDRVGVPRCGSPCRIALLGTLNGSNTDAVCRLANVIMQHRGFELKIFSGAPFGRFRSQGISGPNITYDRVEPDRVVSALQQCDVFFLPHGLSGDWSPVEYETIFPTRTISYLWAARPILAHVPRDCFLDRWLREHQCAEIVNQPDADLLCSALKRLRDDRELRQRLVDNALVAAREFRGSVVANDLRRCITNECRSGA